MKAKVTKFKGRFVPISEWFGAGTYNKTASGETLLFTRIFETELGNMLAEFDLYKDDVSGKWLGEMEACIIDNKGEAIWSNTTVAYTSDELFQIRESSSTEIPIQELADEYSAGENVENFHIGWSNDTDDEATEERLVNFFGSRFIGNHRWIVSAEIWKGDEYSSKFVGELSDFEVLDLIECFSDKYERKYFA